MYGAEDKDFVISKYKYLRALTLLVITVFSTTTYSDFAVFTTSESSSLEGVSGRYFGSQVRDLLDIPESEITVVYDPYPIDFEDIVSDLAKSNSGKSSHLIYLALPTSYSGNMLTFSFDGELVSLQEIYSIIEGLQGDYLLIMESGEGFPSQLKFPNVPNNVSIIGAEISSRLQTLNDLSEAPPYASDLSILFFQELIRAESGQKVSIERITALLSRKYEEEINTYYFYGGSGSNLMLPSFIPEPESYYFANSEAETEAEARKEKEAQKIREANAREAREAQALIEKEKSKARDAEEAQAQILKKLKEEQKSAEAKARKLEGEKNIAKAKPEVPNDLDSADEPDLGEALALIEQMKAEAAEREKQLKEANKDAEKKRKNTTSFGF